MAKKTTSKATPAKRTAATPATTRAAASAKPASKKTAPKKTTSKKAPAKKAASAKVMETKTASRKSTPTTSKATASKRAPAKPSAAVKGTTSRAKVPAPASAAAANIPGRPNVGDLAPDFTLLDQDGNPQTLSAARGRPVVLFFYPKDMTSGCTQQACDFRDRLARFNAAKAWVFGVSIMDTKSKKKFADKEGLTFPLLADDTVDKLNNPTPRVAQAYGVWVDKSMYGRTYKGSERVTFLIDAKGRIARRWDKVSVPRHADEVLQAAADLA